MNDSNRFYVYLHRFANGTLYVGKGCRDRAWQSSLNRHNNYWDRLRSKYGPPRVRLLVSGVGEQEALDVEAILIARIAAKGKRFCNRTPGGDGCIGFLVSAETRKKMGDAHRGEKNRMFGRSHPQHVRDSISRANSGRFIGSLSPRYKDAKLHLLNESSSLEFFGTQAEAVNELGISQGWMSRICAGKCASAKGWRLASTPAEDTGRRGKRHGRYDHTVFEFIHDSGILESCTKNELATKYQLTSPSNLSSMCAGRIKSHLGWRLKPTDSTR